MRERLKPATPEQGKRIRGWITELDDDNFSTRQRAQDLILREGLNARTFLREAKAGRLSAESAQRIAKLLAAPEIDAFPSERLRELRAIQALEWIGTPQAREILKDLAQGDPAAFSAREATAALVREKSNAVR